jgi:hypothetical protein
MKPNNIDNKFIGTGGIKFHYENGGLHLIGGPAYIGADGTKEYWIRNKKVTKEEHDLLYNMMKLKGLI